jgi:PAS domain S-box-containing protein
MELKIAGKNLLAEMDERQRVENELSRARDDLEVRIAERTRELGRSEERFRDYASTSSDYFFEMDENLRFSYFSDRFTEITGISPKRLLGKTRQETGIPGVDDEDWRRHLADLAAHRPFRNFVHPRTHPDGRVVFLSINGLPVFDTGNRFMGYRCTGADITATVKADIERRLALKQAKQANQAKSEFMASMSHDLRTPLNAILGFSALLTQQYHGPLNNEKYEEYADNIHTSAEHLLALVNDILDLSTIEARKQSLAKEKFRVGEAVQECTRIIAEEARSRGIELVTKAPGNLPRLYADRRAVKQILLNLLSNALKFTPAGGNITVSATASKRGAVVKIADTGKGIPAKRLREIADPLSRPGYDPYLTGEGWGLGLTITKALVDVHGGTLKIKSKLGKGTTVTVTLPNGKP